MTRDDSVFVMGEEVARYNGAYKVCMVCYDFQKGAGEGRRVVPKGQVTDGGRGEGRCEGKWETDPLARASPSILALRDGG